MANISKSQAPRIHYTDHGWLVDTVFPMTPRQLKVCIDYTRKVQQQRINGMPLGELRDNSQKALDSLSAATIKQNLQTRNPWERDKIAYMADGNHEKNRIISLGAH